MSWKEKQKNLFNEFNKNSIKDILARKEKATEVFNENPFYQERYNKAPQNIKKYYEWGYLNSLSEDETEKIYCNKEMNQLEEKFNPEDWDYFTDEKNMVSGIARHSFAEKRKKLGK